MNSLRERKVNDSIIVVKILQCVLDLERLPMMSVVENMKTLCITIIKQNISEKAVLYLWNEYKT